MRDLGFSIILPLDHNIKIHKFIGISIFCQAWVHTIMHFINFGVNVQPDPVKFMALNKAYFGENVGYQLPNRTEGECTIEQNNQSDLPTQVCPDGINPYSWGEWIFTIKPGVFGLIPGKYSCENILSKFIFVEIFLKHLLSSLYGGHSPSFYLGTSFIMSHYYTWSHKVAHPISKVLQ